MKTNTVTAIILGHKNLGENDKWVFLYTEEYGKIKAVAKGARKITSKFTGHLETLNYCTANLYFGPKNTILSDVFTNKNNFRARNDLDELKNALKIADVTEKFLFESQPISGLTSLIKKTLLHLNSSSKKNLIFTSYIIKLMDKHGTMPDFKEVNTTIPEKYKKFFEYIKTQKFNEIEKIKLTQKETLFIENCISRIIFDQTGRNIIYF